MAFDDDRRAGLLALGLADVRFDLPIGPWTALGIGGPADAVVTRPDDEDALRLLRRWCRRERLSVSDPPSDPQSLVRDAGLKGVVVVPPGDPPEPPRRARLFLEPELPVAAAKLLADSGAAGIRLRGVRIDPDDANTVVAEPGAFAQDVLTLQGWLKDRVMTRTGVELASALTVVGIDRRTRPRA